MTLISLICLLALSSSALGRSTYGSASFGEAQRTINAGLPRVEASASAALQGQLNSGSQSDSYSYGSAGSVQRPTQLPNIEQSLQVQRPVQSQNFEQLASIQRPTQLPSFDQSVQLQRPVQSQNFEQLASIQRPIQSQGYEQSVQAQRPIQSQNFEQLTSVQRPIQTQNIEQSLQVQRPVQSQNFEQLASIQRPVQSQSYGQSVQTQRPIQSQNFEQLASIQRPTQLPSFDQSVQAQRPIQSQNFEQWTSVQRPVQTQTYGQSVQVQRPTQFPSFDQQSVQTQRPNLLSNVEQSVQIPQQTLTQADILCRGQRPETIIPLDEGRRFIVCLEDGKGTEQFCPKGLHFHEETRRCERRLGPLDNACTSNPCLNNGQCIPTDTSSYQCKCAPGFDGFNCELDAQVCQSQQPCGTAPGTRCQSFRSNAALSFVCLFNNDQAYGFNGQQTIPNPCRNVDGPQSLAITEKGFLMCDGERMFIESCPGGTVWDDSTKACVWPDVLASFGLIRNSESFKPSGFESLKPTFQSGLESWKPTFQSSFETSKPTFQSGFESVQIPKELSNIPSQASSQYSFSSGPKTLPRMSDMMTTPATSYGYDQMIQKQPETLQKPLPIQSTGIQSTGSQSTFSRVQKQPDFRSFQTSSSY